MKIGIIRDECGELACSRDFSGEFGLEFPESTPILFQGEPSAAAERREISERDKNNLENREMAFYDENDRGHGDEEFVGNRVEELPKRRNRLPLSRQGSIQILGGEGDEQRAEAPGPRNKRERDRQDDSEYRECVWN